MKTLPVEVTNESRRVWNSLGPAGVHGRLHDYLCHHFVISNIVVIVGHRPTASSHFKCTGLRRQVERLLANCISFTITDKLTRTSAQLQRLASEIWRQIRRPSPKVMKIKENQPEDHSSHPREVFGGLELTPVRWRIQFKLCVIMHCVHNGRAPAYLDNAVQPVNRRARSPSLVRTRAT